MSFIDTAYLALVIAGHWSLCVFTINRIHATGWHHRIVKLIDVVWYLAVFLVPTVMLLHQIDARSANGTPVPSSWLLQGYMLFCAAAAPVAAIVGIRCRRAMRQATLVVSNHTDRIDVVERLGHAPCGSWATKWASRLPGNQVFELWEHTKRIQLRRLDPQLDGLTITHLSDLHLTGRITKDYFQLIVDQVNRTPTDLVIITGDIIDKRRCFSWLAEVLGHIESRVATCFVLGNHDLRIHDEVGLRSELVRLGMIDLGKRYETLQVHGCPIVLGGNELPWFGPAADLSDAPESSLRIAVTHSPDQLSWAKRHDCDLMLCGHTHGGQIRLPLIGPVFTPSRYGVRYAAGTFDEAPTLMHVSRGLSGTRPLRFGCPPELARMELTASRSR